MRTEVRTVPELEFIPVPQEAVSPCLVPSPPLNAKGEIEYVDVPPYAVEVLGILEECNIKLEELRELYKENDKGG